MTKIHQKKLILFVLIFCECAVITYHVFIVITVIVRLSGVGVAVSDQVLHSTTERTRHCGHMGHIVNLIHSQCWTLYMELCLHFWLPNDYVITCFDHIVFLEKYPGVHTSSGVVIGQADQSVAGTRLTVGEAGGRDVVYHLVRF